jgi:putative N6-adenine-specific DNA methylase
MMALLWRWCRIKRVVSRLSIYSIYLVLLTGLPFGVAFLPAVKVHQPRLEGTILRQNHHGLVVGPPTANTPFHPNRRRFGESPLFSSSSSYNNNGNEGGGKGSNNNNIVHSYYLATTVPGLAATLQSELIGLGGRCVECSGNAGVTFAVSDLATIYRILLWSRVAHKVMELLIDSSSMSANKNNGGRGRLMKTRADVYQFVRQHIPVQDLLWDNNGDNQPKGGGTGAGGSGRWRTLSVSTTLNNPRFIPSDINHSHFTALNVKNALVDAAREEQVNLVGTTAGTAATTTGSRPDVDTDDPDVPLVVVLRGIPSEDRRGSDGAQISIYRSLHQGSLHRRGYRTGSAVHKAGLKESLAAGLLLLAGWPPKRADHDINIRMNLLDPMAGSGTFLIEAAMMSADFAPGLMRIRCEVPGAKIPPIVRWQQLGGDGADQRLWQTLLLDAAARAKRGMARLSRTDSDVVIAGNDAHAGAVQLAESAIRRAGFANMIHMSDVDCQHWHTCAATTGCLVVCNPPWGVRLTDDTQESWDALRIFLRDICPPNTTAWILSGNAEVTRHLKLRRSQSIPLQTGEQHLRWLEYNIGGGGGGGSGPSSSRSQSRLRPESAAEESSAVDA